MLRKLASCLALGLLAFSQWAAAMGFGDIEVRSQLNEPFYAEVPLLNPAPGEAESAQVRLASVADYARTGAERIDYLLSLRFEVRSGASPSVVIRSDQPAREPLLSLLLDLRSRGSSLQREYTIFLDPPEVAAPRPPQPLARIEPPAEEPPPSASAGPVPLPAPRSSEPSADTEAAPEASAVSESAAPWLPAAGGPEPEPGSSYGPVADGETFWNIATRARGARTLTMDQVLLAIYEANSSAFDGGFNGLMRGVTLEIPSEADMAATPAGVAHARVVALRRGRGAPSELPAPAASSKAATAATLDPFAGLRDLPPVDPEPETKPEPVPDGAGGPSAAPSSLPPPPSSALAQQEEPAPLTDAAPAATEMPAAEPVAEEPPTAESTMDEVPADTASAPPEEGQPEPPKPVSGKIEAGLPRPLLLGAALLVLLVLLGVYGWRRYSARQAELEFQRASAGPIAPVVTVAGSSFLAPASAADGIARDKSELELLQEAENNSGDGETQPLLEQLEPRAPQPLDSDPLAGFEDLYLDLEPAVAPPPGDPITEADASLAYGLHDAAAAATILRDALVREPGRFDLRMKLAELLFAAGKTAEYATHVASMQNEAKPEDWARLAGMGRQLDPSAPLFAAAAPVSGSLDVDVASSPTLAPALSLELDFPTPAQAPAAPVRSTINPVVGDPGKAAPVAESLAFDLSDFDLTLNPPPASAVAPKPDNMLDFDLSGFDLEPAGTPAGTTTDLDEHDFKLDFDLNAPTEKPVPAAPAVQALELPDSGATRVIAAPPAGALPVQALAEPEPEEQHFDLDEFPVSEDDNFFAGDEVATKLDLARAYVDMGDHEMARSLLDEVIAQGAPDQQREAQQLVARLPA